MRSNDFGRLEASFDDVLFEESDEDQMQSTPHSSAANDDDGTENDLDGLYTGKHGEERFKIWQVRTND